MFRSNARNLPFHKYFPRTNENPTCWHDSGERCHAHDDPQSRAGRDRQNIRGSNGLVRSAGSTRHRTRRGELGYVGTSRPRRRSRMVDRYRQRLRTVRQCRPAPVAPCDGLSCRGGAASTPAAHGIVRTGHRRHAGSLVFNVQLPTSNFRSFLHRGLSVPVSALGSWALAVGS